MPKTTLGKLMASQEALQWIAGQKLPAKLSYKISRVLTDASRRSEEFQKENLKLFQKFGEEIPDKPDTWQLKKENTEAYQSEFADLIAIEAETWGDPVKLDELGDLAIAPAHVAALDWLIVEA